MDSFYAVDPQRWPFTSVVLATLGKHERAAQAQAPTLFWAYGAALDKYEQAMLMVVLGPG